MFESACLPAGNFAAARLCADRSHHLERPLLFFPLSIRMNTSARRLAPALFLFFTLTTLAQAHPGHDGGHDVTWELGHLIDHPLATLACFSVMAAGAVLAWLLVRRENVRQLQSLRVSQRKRGN